MTKKKASTRPNGDKATEPNEQHQPSGQLPGVGQAALWMAETALWVTLAPFIVLALLGWVVVIAGVMGGWGMTEWMGTFQLLSDILGRAAKHPEVASRIGTNFTLLASLSGGAVLIRRIVRTGPAQRAAKRLQGRLDKIVAPVAEPFDSQPYWFRAGGVILLLLLSALIGTWLR